MNEQICGWRTVRRLAMQRVHERIREEEKRLGRELTEPEFRSLLSRALSEELRRAFTTCQTEKSEEGAE